MWGPDYNRDRVLKSMQNRCCTAAYEYLWDDSRQELRSAFTFQIVSWRFTLCVRVLSLNGHIWGLFIQWIVFPSVAQHKCSGSELQHTVSLKTEVKWIAKHARQKSTKCDIFYIVGLRNICNATKIFFWNRKKKPQTSDSVAVITLFALWRMGPSIPSLNPCRTAGWWWHFGWRRIFYRCLCRAGNGWVKG